MQEEGGRPGETTGQVLAGGRALAAIGIDNTSGRGNSNDEGDSEYSTDGGNDKDNKPPG
jgi:hypothetical protein